MEKLLLRINELAKKAKEQGLSEEELKERDELRKQYIEKFRQSTRATLEQVYIVDEEGNKRKLGKRES